jgi:uncharacterized RDD family membrane protein YckC
MQPESQQLPLARPSGLIDSAPWSSGSPAPTQAFPTPARQAPAPDEFAYPAMSASTVGVGVPSLPSPTAGPDLSSYNDTQLAPPQPSGSLPGADGSSAVAQTAPISARIGAALLDSMIGSGLSSIGWGAAVLVGVLGASLPWQPLFALMVLALSFFLAIMLYNTIYRVGRTGQSWGKKMVLVAVVDIDTGLPVGTGRALLRSLVLGLPILGWLSVLFDSSGRGRGWADLASHARVVRVESGVG